ncbi:MAG: hypothetical protein JKY01_12560 [Pseudomonadales bacterium]|nr:hypothetical protein [Pseudomonadales bacterium]
MTSKTISYSNAIQSGFCYLLDNFEEVFVLGQGLWSPWYVGQSMRELEVTYGRERIMDTPVSEQGSTGVAIGASLCGYRPIIVHPRIDFMLMAMDQIVNQAAKWSHMLGGQAHPSLTIRGIVNRGGEQGAQHSQALQSWFAHIPGLRVVMPSTVSDARDLLIASVLSDDPVIYIDDRWLYDNEEELEPVVELSLGKIGPKISQEGTDLTIVGIGHSAYQSRVVAARLRENGIYSEVIDLRVLNPMRVETIIRSVRKTGRLVVVDGAWSNCGVAGEVIASVVEKLDVQFLKASPVRVTLPSAPAPSSGALEKNYYISESRIASVCVKLMGDKKVTSKLERVV